MLAAHSHHHDHAHSHSHPSKATRDSGPPPPSCARAAVALRDPHHPSASSGPFALEYDHITPPPEVTGIPVPPRNHAGPQAQILTGRSCSHSEFSDRSSTSSSFEQRAHSRACIPGTGGSMPVAFGVPDPSTAASTGLAHVVSASTALSHGGSANLRSEQSVRVSPSRSAACSSSAHRTTSISTNKPLLPAAAAAATLIDDDTQMNNDNRPEHPNELLQLLASFQAAQVSQHSVVSSSSGNRDSHNALPHASGISTRGYPSDGFNDSKSRDAPGNSHSRSHSHGAPPFDPQSSSSHSHSHSHSPHRGDDNAEIMERLKSHLMHPSTPTTLPPHGATANGRHDDINRMFPVHHIPQIPPMPLSFPQFTSSSQSSPAFSNFPIPGLPPHGGAPSAASYAALLARSYPHAHSLPPPTSDHHNPYDLTIARMYSYLLLQNESSHSSPPSSSSSLRSHQSPPPHSSSTPAVVSAPATPPTASAASPIVSSRHIVAPTPISGARPVLPPPTLPSSPGALSPSATSPKVASSSRERGDDYKCSYCDARFSNESQRKRHTRTHTGECECECE